MKKDPLPAPFVAWLRQLVLKDRSHNVRRIHRWIIIRWCLWTDGIQSNAIPGYDAPPPADERTGFPAGWSIQKFTAIARETIGTTAIHQARQAAASLSSH